MPTLVTAGQLTIVDQNDSLIYYLALSSPVITKDAPDAATSAAHSSITIQGKKSVGSIVSNYGWITVTANDATQESTTATDTASSVYTLNPGTTSGKTKYTIKMYDRATVSEATLLDTKEVSVIFKGAAGGKGDVGFTGASVFKAYTKTSSNSTTWTAGTNYLATTTYNTTNNTAPLPSVGTQTFTSTPPTLGTNDVQWETDGTMASGTTTINWTKPYLSYFQVGSLSAITSNMGELNAGSIVSGTKDTNGNMITGVIIGPRGIKVISNSVIRVLIGDLTWTSLTA